MCIQHEVHYIPSQHGTILSSMTYFVINPFNKSIHSNVKYQISIEENN